MFSVTKGNHLLGRLTFTELIIIQCMILVSIVTLTASSSLRILGGRDVKIDELPYVVRLETEIRFTKKNKNWIRYEFLCTGSTLTPHWTLTAGHCFTDDDKVENYKKVVAYGTPTGKSKGSKRSYILDVFSRYKEQYGKNEDIALLKTESITLEKYGKLSALDYASLLYQEVTMAGYGDTNSSSSDVELSTAYDLRKPLQVMKAMLVSCADDESLNTLGYLCVNSKCSQPATSCAGDSGGPIIHSTGIIGVDSRGPLDNNCQIVSDFFRTPDMSVIFLVSPYINWINKVVNSDDTKMLSEV